MKRQFNSWIEWDDNVDVESVIVKIDDLRRRIKLTLKRKSAINKTK